MDVSAPREDWSPVTGPHAALRGFCVRILVLVNLPIGAESRFGEMVPTNRSRTLRGNSRGESLHREGALDRGAGRPRLAQSGKMLSEVVVVPRGARGSVAVSPEAAAIS